MYWRSLLPPFQIVLTILHCVVCPFVYAGPILKLFLFPTQRNIDGTSSEFAFV